MLMTQTIPGPARVTPHGERMLEAIRGAGGEWVNRRQIAEWLGKKRLTQWELGLLPVLEQAGLIEAQKRNVDGPISYEWVYRPKAE